MSAPAEPSERLRGFGTIMSYLDHARESRAASGPDWLFEVQGSALARVRDQGLPTRRDEDWKYTNLAAISAQSWGLAPAVNVGTIAARLDAATIPGAARLVLVNGHPVPELATDLQTGVTARSIAALRRDGETDRLRAVYDESPVVETTFSGLNTAMLSDGYAIDVAAQTSVETPIQVVHVSAPGAGSRAFVASPRLSVHVGRGAHVKLVETSIGLDEGECLVNRVVDMTVDDGASLEHVLVQEDAATTSHIGMTRVRVARDARYASTVVTFGGKLVRNDLHVVLDAEGAHADLGGLYHVRGDQHVDNHTFIDHSVAHTTSRELYKGVLAERARGIFFGRILVRPDAQKISAVQTNNNLLLSDEALANSTPQLEIYADDVQCRHGSTIGQIDETARFYLRSRGISDSTARELLTYAFANEVIDRVSMPALRERLASRLTSVAVD